MIFRLVLLVLACALDVAITARNLKTGGREINYLPAALVAKVGMWPTLLGTKAIIILAAVLIDQAGFYDVAIVLNLAAAVYGFLHRAKAPKKPKA